MVLQKDVIAQMKKRLTYECESIRDARDEMEKLADQYNRYVDLHREQDKRIRRVQRITALLESGNFLVEAIERDKLAVIADTLEMPLILDVNDLPLWETMKEYLLYAKEARIDDIVSFAVSLKVKTANRQAIESALKRHPETFGTRKKGNEKYIYLKEGIAH